MFTIDPNSRVLDLRDCDTDDVKSGKKEGIEMAGYVIIFPTDTPPAHMLELSREMFHVTELVAPDHTQEGFTIEAWMKQTLIRFQEDVAKNTEGSNSVICMYARILSGRFKNTAAAHPMALKDPMFHELVAHITGSAGGETMAASFGQRVN